jgi:hypothetical protein
MRRKASASGNQGHIVDLDTGSLVEPARTSPTRHDMRRRAEGDRRLAIRIGQRLRVPRGDTRRWTVERRAQASVED